MRKKNHRYDTGSRTSDLQSLYKWNSEWQNNRIGAELCDHDEFSERCGNIGEKV